MRPVQRPDLGKMALHAGIPTQLDAVDTRSGGVDDRIHHG